MIISDNVDFQITPRFYSELSTENKKIVDNLKNFTLTQVADIKYIVYTIERDVLDLESNQEENVRILRADLGEEKSILDVFITMCETLLNT